jgi:hypothetical protein
MRLFGSRAETGLLDNSTHKFKGLGGLARAHHPVVRRFDQAFLNSVESQRRAFQDEEEILSSDGVIGGMNEVPPAADGLLDLGLGFFAYNQGIDQPVDLALDRLIRDRNFLRHEFFGLSRFGVSNLPSKP